MDFKNKMDVSRFMLFEATGDSEVDGATDAVMMDEHSAVADGGDDDDDDAESCCHEGSESQNWDVGDQQLGGHKSCGVVDAEYEHCEGKQIDEEESGGYGTSYCDEDEIQKRHHRRSSLSGESGQQLMDEMEKNRRFWESCLAS